MIAVLSHQIASVDSAHHLPASHTDPHVQLIATAVKMLNIVLQVFAREQNAMLWMIFALPTLIAAGLTFVGLVCAFKT